ncbi:MAG: hypothetical protein Q4A60_07100 [Pasteurellaceae bacterium]|nr:hypothetical protein [Pasteurellaceae bacterium]
MNRMIKERYGIDINDLGFRKKTFFFLYFYFVFILYLKIPLEEPGFHYQTNRRCNGAALEKGVYFFFNDYLERYMYYLKHEYGYCSIFGCDTWIVPKNGLSKNLEQETYRAYQEFRKYGPTYDVNYFPFLMREINATKISPKDIKFNLLKDNLIIFDDASSITIYDLDEFTLEVNEKEEKIKVKLYNSILSDNNESSINYYIIKYRNHIDTVVFCYK